MKLLVAFLNPYFAYGIARIAVAMVVIFFEDILKAVRKDRDWNNILLSAIAGACIGLFVLVGLINLFFS